MKLLTKAIEQKLDKNWPDDSGMCYPVLKLFNPCGAGYWLFTSRDPECHDFHFGLCDLGMGFPELGSQSLQELQNIRLPFGLVIERDLHFKATHPIQVYAAAARIQSRITFSRAHLEAAQQELDFS